LPNYAANELLHAIFASRRYNPEPEQTGWICIALRNSLSQQPIKSGGKQHQPGGRAAPVLSIHSALIRRNDPRERKSDGMTDSGSNANDPDGHIYEARIDRAE
jgi:hypothetical protein